MQSQTFDAKIELLFIDGQSTDGSRELLQEMRRGDPRIRVIDNPERQTAKALNLGLEASRGEYIVRMDAHTFYPPMYIQSGVERLRRGGVAWVCGAQVAVGEGPWSRRVALALNNPLGTGTSRRFGRGSEKVETDLDTGVFTGVWKRSTLEEHGGWDEGWPVNQDSELAARILDAGGRIVSIPDLDAEYVPRNNPKALARQYLRYGYYRAKTTRRHPSSMRYGHLFPPSLVATGLAALVAPKALARPARAGVLVYALAAVAFSARAAGDAPTSDKLALPAVFVTMHAAWGLGFLGGILRFAVRAPKRTTSRGGCTGAAGATPGPFVPG
jgi:cellulose synthase/poly-beta-1,6-N-acetylglucosamine synthase-like glycosyltransferase